MLVDFYSTFLTFMSVQLFFLFLSDFKTFLPIAGHCFAKVDENSKCKQLIGTNFTRDDCCTQHGSGAAYSDKQLPPGMIFFVDAFKKEIECTPCNKTLIPENKNKTKRPGMLSIFTFFYSSYFCQFVDVDIESL